MPVATSSRRRKSARQASSDIEEDQPTQGTRAAARDDVDEEEEDAPRRSKKDKVQVKKEAVKKEKGKARQEEDDDEDDEDDRIDIANFADQPLTKADGPKIVGLSKDWQSVEGVMHQPASIISAVAAAIAEVDGDEAQEGLAELDRVMKGLLDVQALMTGHSKVLTDIIQSVATGEKITDANARYLSLADDMNAEYDKKTTRQKYLKNEEYVAFKEAIYEVEHPGSAMPPMTDFIPREPGDESDDDDDIVMGGVTQEYKCPLMMTLLKDPMTSQIRLQAFVLR
ncbi:E3 SUMO-protein ligase nse2 [Mycena sanguinolenta]|uniref:E3 SUMO-protein ligase nse2 n=1 Tax=Mycena sanguinolenta TaxID=230812 RepID=A0A8H6XS30_9AGAR|nr:E3 SUMO-protein ligase nse2 [Mycena sanguinolenta]